MNVELKTVKLTKSKINQMEYIGIPKNPNVEVLGWVNIDNKRFVIVKSFDNYYRAEYITKLESEIKVHQFPDGNGGWIYPNVIHIKGLTFNGTILNYSPDINDVKNTVFLSLTYLELYEHLINFKRKSEKAGQIYY